MLLNYQIYMQQKLSQQKFSAKREEQPQVFNQGQGSNPQLPPYVQKKRQTQQDHNMVINSLLKKFEQENLDQ